MSGEKSPDRNPMRTEGAQPALLNEDVSADSQGPQRRSPASSAGDLASATPLVPDISGRPFLIGQAGDSDVKVGADPADSADSVHATIYHTSEGWIVVDGVLHEDGTMSPSRSGVFVNGRRVQDYAAIAADDVLKIGRTVFRFVDPLKEEHAETGEALDLGSPWFRCRESDGTFAATASFRGLIDKYNENQDRMAFRSRPDAGAMMVAIDGMGGHDSGERAAELGRRAFYEAVDAGLDLERTLESMNSEMFRDNLARGTRGGAVIAGVHLHPEGWLEVRTVGDAEVLLISLPSGRSAPEAAEDLRIDYWSTRPTQTQSVSYQIPTLPDGRILLGHERIVRLDPASNVVDTAAGMRPSTREMQTTDRVSTLEGRTYLALPMSDGLTEQYISHEEILEVVRDHVRTTGDLTPAGIRDALLRDSLLRCSLCRMCNREGRVIDITSTRVRQAHREVSLEMEGVDPAVDAAPWRYQSRTDEAGKLVHYFLVPFSGSAYLVRGAEVEGHGWVPDPYVVDLATGNIRFNPAQVFHPSVVGRFKQDNISVGVVSFIRPTVS